MVSTQAQQPMIKNKTKEDILSEIFKHDCGWDFIGLIENESHANLKQEAEIIQMSITEAMDVYASQESETIAIEYSIFILRENYLATPDGMYWIKSDDDTGTELSHKELYQLFIKQYSQ